MLTSEVLVQTLGVVLLYWAFAGQAVSCENLVARSCFCPWSAMGPPHDAIKFKARRSIYDSWSAMRSQDYSRPYVAFVPATGPRLTSRCPTGSSNSAITQRLGYCSSGTQ